MCVCVCGRDMCTHNANLFPACPSVDTTHCTPIDAINTNFHCFRITRPLRRGKIHSEVSAGSRDSDLHSRSEDVASGSMEAGGKKKKKNKSAWKSIKSALGFGRSGGDGGAGSDGNVSDSSISSWGSLLSGGRRRGSLGGGGIRLSFTMSYLSLTMYPPVTHYKEEGERPLRPGQGAGSRRRRWLTASPVLEERALGCRLWGRHPRDRCLAYPVLQTLCKKYNITVDLP